jgi:hypothetical protein
VPCRGDQPGRKLLNKRAEMLSVLIVQQFNTVRSPRPARMCQRPDDFILTRQAISLSVMASKSASRRSACGSPKEIQGFVAAGAT